MNLEKYTLRIANSLTIVKEESTESVGRQEFIQVLKTTLNEPRQNPWNGLPLSITSIIAFPSTFLSSLVLPSSPHLTLCLFLFEL